MKNTVQTIALILLLLTIPAGTAYPHCDGVDGPVVMAAKKSLETEDISHVLIWVKKENEQQIRNAFSKTLKVRKLGPEAMEVADHHFFETVVRIHRQGEGEPFTGIKAAGRDLGPVIPAADKSIQTGSLDEIKELIAHKILSGLEEKFNNLSSRKSFDISDTEAGRQYVEAYVEYLHYAENLYKSAEFNPHSVHNKIMDEEEHNH